MASDEKSDVASNGSRMTSKSKEDRHHRVGTISPVVAFSRPGSANELNPQPQLPPGDPEGCNPVLLSFARKDPHSGTSQDKIVVVLVGLPARGKTHIARRLGRYLNFFHACPTKQINVGEYRRSLFGKHLSPEFFDHSNQANVDLRNQACAVALADLKTYMQESDDCRVGFFDATNSTKSRRKWLFTAIEAMGAKPIFLESICTDSEMVLKNIFQVKLESPDFEDVDSDSALAEFRERIENYEKVYETIDANDEDEKDWTWIKMIDGKRYTINNLRGYLPTQMVQFLMHTHPYPPQFFLSRHGQSQYNASYQIGGDSVLTEVGWEYARRLARYANDVISQNENGQMRPTRLWTSTLKRTKETASLIHQRRLCKAEHGIDWVQFRHREWRNLDEIYAGACDGMTYAEIEHNLPDEFVERSQHKLTYRYPRGESYLDLIHRLHNCILEMERAREPVLIVAHQAVLRIIYAYWMGLPTEVAPTVSMPLHTVITLTPKTYACDERRELLYTLEEADGTTSTGSNSFLRCPSERDPPSH